jgi:acyl CoA:acetate/3-ketoacid CoA transferase beta subunit
VTADFTLDELCVVACAEVWRGDGEILASPIGTIPALGARLAQRTFAPDLLLSDGNGRLVDADGAVEGWLPFRAVFDVVWSGRRHVMMGAAQIDRYGNQNISCIGPWARPRAQLLGVRGAPGNTVNHPTSYWVPAHSPRSFVARVDAVCGVGTDRGGGRFHALRRVVSGKGVFDFGGPDGTMRILSLHPGVSLADVQAATGFALTADSGGGVTRTPTAEELQLIREVLDPAGVRRQEIR